MISITKMTYAELEANSDFDALVTEYGKESCIEGMPEHNRDSAMYNTLEKAGVFQAFGAYDNDTLIGFIVVLVSNNPHYGKVIGTIESFFVSKAKRKTGAGLKLLRISEIFCKEFGAVGLFLSTPVESQLAKTMEKLSPYKETNRVFFRSL